MRQFVRGFVVVLLLCDLVNGEINGETITRTPLEPPQEMTCLEECEVFDNGTLVLINITNPKQAVAGVAYATHPVRMKDTASRTVASFNSSFTFREHPESYDVSNPNGWRRGDGFTFAFVSSSSWTGGVAGRLGMFKDTGQLAKVVAVEFDNWKNNDTDTEPDEHVGVDIASARSLPNCTALVQPLGFSLWKGATLFSWIEYDAASAVLEVRVANASTRPGIPSLRCTRDLYDHLDEFMWIGFSGAHGDAWSVYYISNWTFTSFGIAGKPVPEARNSRLELVLGVCGGSLAAVVLAIVILLWRYWKRRRDRECCDMEGLLEMASMSEFITFKHLSAATKQFSEQSKLGAGGFGNVYRGVLPKTGAHVAVKKVSSDSKQGQREFLAEVKIISQLRHRNVVELVGFCRDRGKYLLAYELLPRGSLDQALFKPKELEVLSWSQRWKIASGTAAALHYLHEGWRQQVIHRDVKSSNIMLDVEWNAKLGDFGLARLVDHQKNAATTMMGGTWGYLAPEASGGKFTDKTDVYAFGAVALELGCGRKAFSGSADEDDMLLVDMVWRRLKEGRLLTVVDSRLRTGEYDEKEIEVLLLLGLLCSHPSPGARPCMRQVVQVLAGEAPLPPVPTSKPEPVFSSADVVSVYKRKLSAKSGLLLRSVSGKSGAVAEHSIVTTDSDMTGAFSSFPSEHTSSDPDVNLLRSSKIN